MPQETGKQRAARIPLDYFKAPNPLETWKSRLGWAALLLPAVWLGGSYLFSLARGEEADLHASRGPVAALHQTWDSQCSACHVAFQAISSDSFVPPFINAASVNDQTCKKCHDGPIHHQGQLEDRNCAACHREHRGRDASLTRMGDADCTICHKNLKGHTIAATSFANTVTRFDIDHPDFRSIKSDPGKLAFDHELHLRPGMPKKNAAARFRLQDIGERSGPAHQERYTQAQQRAGKPFAAVDLVELNCQACHQLDSADFPLPPELEKEIISGVSPPRAAGGYFLPLNYENHCKACHPFETTEMRWDAMGEDARAEKAQAANARAVKANIALPHRLQPPQVLSLLKDYFTAQAARGQVGFLEQKARMPLPGKALEKPLEPELAALVEKTVKQAEVEFFTAGLQKNCALCHQFEGEGKARTVVPPNVPLVWFEHARFDHTAHRAIDCRQCHVGVDSSSDAAQVLIPNRSKCLDCHAPRSQASGKALGGARYDCVECHRYHNGDHPWQGLGSSLRGVRPQMTIESFLKRK